jgi:hypothetical protein
LETKVILVNDEGGITQEGTIADLLPGAFRPSDLARA